MHPPAAALAQLAARGLVPPGLEWVGATPPRDAQYVVEAADGAERRVWVEPLPGLLAAFEPPAPLDDHVSYLAERADVGGVPVRLVRAVLTQPYGPERVAAAADAAAPALLRRSGVRLDVAADLAWHAEGTALCVFAPAEATPASAWRLGVRAWLVATGAEDDGPAHAALCGGAAWLGALGTAPGGDEAARAAFEGALEPWEEPAGVAGMWREYVAWRAAARRPSVRARAA